MSIFKSVVTTLRQSRITAANAAGTDINITQLAVSDGKLRGDHAGCHADQTG